MAFSSYRTRFEGELNNVSIEDLKELDYNINTLKGRLAYINKKYKKVKPFYDSYIFTSENEDDMEFYKVNLNVTDELSSEINIFKMCERDASYLLNSTDLPRDKQQQYTILDETEFKKVLARESAVSALASDEESKLTILSPKSSNDYSNLNHKILKIDLEHSECGKVLEEYNVVKNYLKLEMEKCKRKEEGSLSLYSIKKMLQTINDDMILSKIQLRGIRNHAKRLGDEGSNPDFGSIDYSNPEHVKALLKNIRFGEIEPNNEMSHIAYDMEKSLKTLFKTGGIDAVDMEIAECYNSGYTLNEIAEEIGRDSKTVRQRLDKIFRRISDFYNK